MMWVIKGENGGHSWTVHEDIAASLRLLGYEVAEVIPASEVREKDELIGRLADEVARRGPIGETLLHSFGLRKVGGTWERCK